MGDLADLLDIEIGNTKDQLGNLALFPDQHLNVPIRGSIYEWFHHYYTKQQFPPNLQDFKKDRVMRMTRQVHDPILHKLIENNGYTHLINDPSNFTGKIFTYWNTHNWNKSHIEQSLDQYFLMSCSVSWEITTIQEKGISLNRAFHNDHSSKFIECLFQNQQLCNLFYLSVFFRSCVLTMNQVISQSNSCSSLDYYYSKSGSGHIIHSSKNITASTHGEGAAVALEGKIYNLSRDALIGICDLTHQRFNLMLSTTINSYLNLPQYPSLETINSILSWGDSILIDNGQKGYDMIKTLEGVCISVLIERNDERICDNLKYWQSILTDIEDKCGVYGIQKLTTLREIISFLSNDHVSQIFGLFRIWGHPIVMTLSGVEKVKKASLRTQIPDHELSNEVLWMFRFLFIQNYIKKHKLWPNCELTEGCSDYLKHCYEAGISPDRYSPSFHLNDMEKITLKQTFSPDPTFNISSMMSDKALSLTKSVLIQTIKRTKGIGKAADRRVILTWLNSNIVDAESLMRLIDQYGLSEEDKVIGVVPKEREMKVDPRLFAILTLTARLYFVITEALIAEHLLPYFPQITMSFTGLELQKTLFNVTKSQQYESKGDMAKKEYITLNIDFERWNLMMRDWLSRGLFREIDHLLGYNNLIQRTHEIFSSSTIYVADEEATIEVHDNDFVQGPYCWTNHLGGFEGQRQKGWTILTVCLIELSTSALKLQHKLVGQGDNQVLVIEVKIPKLPSEYHQGLNYRLARERFNQFKTTFYTICERAGLPVKTSETWESSHVFAYGKSLFYNGNPLPMSCKRLCRQFSMANEDFPSLTSEISTIYAAGNASTQSDLDPTLSYFQTTFQAAWCIIQNLRFSVLCNRGLINYLPLGGNIEWVSDLGERHRISVTKNMWFKHHMKQFIFLCLLRPKTLGGLPIQFLSTFYTRGFPDPVTEAYSMLKKMYHFSNLPEIKKIINYIVSIQYRTKSSPLMLLQDPVSLNIEVPQTSNGIVKREAMKFLKSYPINNDHFKELLNFDDQLYLRLAERLYSLNPFHAYFLSDVLEASIPGYVQSFFNRITKTATILDQTTRTKGESMFHKLMINEINYFYFLYDHYQQASGYKVEMVDFCSVNKANYMRSMGWGGRNIYGVTVPHPVELFKICTHQGNNSCTSCQKDPHSDHFRINIDNSLIKAPHLITSQIGPNTPYVGSETTEKNKKLIGATSINMDSVIKRPIKLLRTIGWFIPYDSPAANMLVNLVRSISDINPDPFMSITEDASGSEFHRYSGLKTKRTGMISTIYRLASYFQLSTNTLYRFGKGQENTNLHFQSLMVHCQQVLSCQILENYRMSILPYIGLHAHIHCESCIKVITDDELIGDSKWEKIQFPELNTKFTKVPSDTISIDYMKGLYTIDYQKFNHEEVSYDILTESYYKRIGLIGSSYIIRHKDELFSDSFYTMPYVWIARGNPIKIIEYTVTSLFLTWVAMRLPNLQPPIYLKHLIDDFYIFIKNLPVHCFYYFQPLFMDEEDRLLLRTCNYKFNMPHSIPITTYSASSSVKNMFLQMLYKDFDFFSYIITNFSFAYLLEGYNYSHDFFLSCISRWIDDQCLDSELPLLIVLKQFLQIYNHSETHEITECMMILQENYPDLSHSILQNLLVLIKNNVILITTPIDSVSRLIQKEIYYRREHTTIKSNENRLYVNSLIEQICKNTNKNASFYVPGSSNIFRYHKSFSMDLPNIVEFKSIIPDYINLYYRHPSLSTSAWIKIISFILPLFKHPPKTIISCGDGTGGISAALMTLYPNAYLYFNTLINLSNVVPHSLPQFIPSSFDFIPNYQSRVINWNVFSDSITDITHPDFASTVLSYLQDNNNPDLVVCDAEGVGWNNYKFAIDILKSLIKITLGGNKNCVLIMKTYLVNPEIVLILIEVCYMYFSKVNLVRSYFSSHDNTECYLVAHASKVSKYHNPILPLSIENNKLVGVIAVPQTYIPKLADVKQWKMSFDKSPNPEYTTSIQDLGLELFYQNNVEDYIHSLVGADTISLLTILAQEGISLNFQRELSQWWRNRITNTLPAQIKKIHTGRSEFLNINIPRITEHCTILVALLVSLVEVNIRLDLLKTALDDSFFYWQCYGIHYFPMCSVGTEYLKKLPVSNEHPNAQTNRAIKIKLFNHKRKYRKMLVKITGCISLYLNKKQFKSKYKYTTIDTIPWSIYVNLPICFSPINELKPHSLATGVFSPYPLASRNVLPYYKKVSFLPNNRILLLNPVKDKLNRNFVKLCYKLLEKYSFLLPIDYDPTVSNNYLSLIQYPPYTSGTRDRFNKEVLLPQPPTINKYEDIDSHDSEAEDSPDEFEDEK